MVVKISRGCVRFPYFACVVSGLTRIRLAYLVVAYSARATDSEYTHGYAFLLNPPYPVYYHPLSFRVSTLMSKVHTSASRGSDLLARGRLREKIDCVNMI